MSNISWHAVSPRYYVSNSFQIDKPENLPLPIVSCAWLLS